MQEYLQFVLSHWDLFAALIIVLLLLAWNIYGHKIQGYTPMTPGEAVSEINHNNARIIDVREQKEVQQTGKIANSVHKSLRDLHKISIKDFDNDTQKPIIAVCKSGNRSSFACSKLKKLGFKNVYNLKGGVLGWQKAGYPLTKK